MCNQGLVVLILCIEQSSQWDGLRHFSQTVPGQSERVFYGGVTSQEINDRQNDRIGMQHWAREGIAGKSSISPAMWRQTYLVLGRGVLIDYASWAEKKGIEYTTFSTHQVRLTDILEIAKENNITFQKGDILFVRVGVTKEWDNSMTDAQKQAYSDNSAPEHAGVEATEDVLRWLWNTGFAAIASDAISWEVCCSRTSASTTESFTVYGKGYADLQLNCQRLINVFNLGVPTSVSRHFSSRVCARGMGDADR